MSELIRVLRQTHTDHGVMIWLTAPNRELYGHEPAALIHAGRIAEVYDVALCIEGQECPNPTAAYPEPQYAAETRRAHDAAVGLAAATWAELEAERDRRLSTG